DDVIAFAHFCDERRNLRWIVLQIAVHRDDDFALRSIEAGLEAGSLPEVPSQTNGSYARIAIADFGKNLESAVAASIIDKDDFISAAQLGHGRDDSRIQRPHVGLFVKQRNNDG